MSNYRPPAKDTLGRGLINAGPKPEGRELNEGEDVCRPLFVTSGDAAEMLDRVKELLDQIAIPIEVWIEADRISPIAARRYVRPASAQGDVRPDGVRIIRLVGQKNPTLRSAT